MRIFLALLFLSISGQCFGADYWVYIRLVDRIGDTVENNAGRSKAGDIVQVLPVTPTNTPTETEKSEWFIVKVLNVSDALYQMAMKEWNEEQPDGKIKSLAYRRYKLNLSALKITKTGLYPTSFNASKISSNLAQKTSSDLAKYEAKRMYLAMQKPCVLIAKSLFSVIVQTAYAATDVVKKINCSAEDYNTLTLWEDATDVDLVTADQIQIAECYEDDGVLDDIVNVDGGTVNSTHYRKIAVATASRHTGKAGTGFCIDPSAFVEHGYGVVSLNEAYSVLDGVEIKGWRGEYGGNYCGISMGNNISCTAKNCIVHDDVSTNAAATVHGIVLANLNYVYNNIVYNISDSGINQTENNPINKYIYNNTVYNFNTTTGTHVGIRNLGTGAVTKNNIVIEGSGGGDCFSYTASDTNNNYNIASDTTATGNHSLTDNTAAANFTNASGGDFTLISTANAKYAGVAISGYTTDAIGTAWNSPPSVGALEYVASGSPAPSVPMLPQVLLWQQ